MRFTNGEYSASNVLEEDIQGEPVQRSRDPLSGRMLTPHTVVRDGMRIPTGTAPASKDWLWKVRRNKILPETHCTETETETEQNQL